MKARYSYRALWFGASIGMLTLTIGVNAGSTDPVITGHNTTFDEAAPSVCMLDPSNLDGFLEDCKSPSGIDFRSSGDSDCEIQFWGTSWCVPLGDNSQWCPDALVYVDGAINGNRNAVIEGQVTYSKFATQDNPLNHDSRDRNIFIYPDLSYWSMLAYPGNFESGEPNEKGRLEVEWETAALPEWALPMQGDWVHVQGNYIFDCGHPPYRTEIHPPRLVMTIRDAAQDLWTRPYNRTLAEPPPNEVIGPRPGWADKMPGLGSVPVQVTRADIFASSDGTEACQGLECSDSYQSTYQPLSDSNYDLFVPAPPKPNGEYEMIWTLTPRLIPGCLSDEEEVPFGCDMDDILVNHPERFDFRPISKDGKPGLGIHIDFAAYKPNAIGLYGFGFTVKVAWNKPASAPPRRVRVTLDHINVTNTMDDCYSWCWDSNLENCHCCGFLDGEFAIGALIGDQFKHILLTNDNGDVSYAYDQRVPYSEDVNTGVYDIKGSGNECGLEGSLNPDSGNCEKSFVVTLLPGQPLRIFVRGDESDLDSPNDEIGVVEHIFTESENYGIGGGAYSDGHYEEWFQERTSAGEDALDDACSSPNKPCLQLWYHIEDALLPVVYVDHDNNTGVEDGTGMHPFSTVDEGIYTAALNATIVISGGEYPENLLLTTPLTLRAEGGNVRIGR